jgi:transcriptional regulator with XRE-family HTH domain
MDEKNPLRIGRRIALYRKRSKLSAEELSSRVGRGLTRSILANLESGRKQDLTVSQLIGISAVLGLRPIDLIFDLSEPNERISLTDGASSLTASTWLVAEWFSSRLPTSQLDAESDGEPVELENEGENAVLLEMLRRRWGLHYELKPLLPLRDEDAYSDPGLNRMVARRQQIQSELWELERNLRAAGVKLIEPIGPRG